MIAGAFEILLGLGATLAVGVPGIRWLHRLKFGQAIREEGPESHKAKAGTPTMGGVLFLIPALLVTLLFYGFSPQAIALVLLVASFTAIGFADDYLIILKKDNKGIRPRYKFGLQVLAAALYALWLYFSGHQSYVLVPFSNTSFDLGLFYWPFIVFILAGTNNAVNLTDGLDGLAAGTVAIACVTFCAMLFLNGAENTPAFTLAALTVGGCLGFLWFNGHPAKVFMGDTGSLGLGGVVAGVAIAGHLELWLAVVGVVFVAEALSVMLQVLWFKRTGKRIFRMSPLHHHFELGGWKETQVVMRFYLVGMIAALISLATFVKS